MPVCVWPRKFSKLYVTQIRVAENNRQKEYQFGLATCYHSNSTDVHRTFVQQSGNKSLFTVRNQSPLLEHVNHHSGISRNLYTRTHTHTHRSCSTWKLHSHAIVMQNTNRTASVSVGRFSIIFGSPILEKCAKNRLGSLKRNECA